MKKFAIIAAMNEEYELLKKYFGDRVESEKYGLFEVDVYEKNDKKIYFVKSGVGEIHAAAATQYVILRYGVDCVFNFGLAGGIADGSKIGGLYLVSGVVHYDFDTSALDGTCRGQYKDGVNPVYPTDRTLRQAVKNIIPDIKEGVCASGDKFVADEDFKSGLKQEFNASVCEMEAAGIYFTAKNAGRRERGRIFFFCRSAKRRLRKTFKKTRRKVIRKGVFYGFAYNSRALLVTFNRAFRLIKTRAREI